MAGSILKKLCDVYFFKEQKPADRRRWMFRRCSVIVTSIGKDYWEAYVFEEPPGTEKRFD
jgi:hypothetical protein